MTMRRTPPWLLLLLLLQSLLALQLACRRDPPEPAKVHDAAAASEGNRVEIPASVRGNLGITFAKVEQRSVAQTVRMPGRFELQPEARREYHTMFAGRVELLVRQFERVDAGTPLFRLISPEWRDLQSRLVDAESTIRQTEARVGSIPLLISAHRRHEAVLEDNIAMWSARVAQLEQSRASGAVTDDEFSSAQNTLAQQRAELAEVLEKEADLEGQIAAARAEHDAAHVRFRTLIATAALLLEVDEAALCLPGELEEHRDAGIQVLTQPASRPASPWRGIDSIEIRAAAPGIVETLALTSGAWASAGSLVVSTVQPERLRFRARAMQSDLARLRDGLPARIVPPMGAAAALQDSMNASLTLGLAADPLERMIDLFATPEALRAWARPGVSAHLEVTTGGGQDELAIPISSVVQDGLARVIFRREPENPDRLQRLVADLGVDDGRWIVIHSGVREGDEVVLDGAYQLLLATSGTLEKGGHFHADGTFHAGEDDKK